MLVQAFGIKNIVTGSPVQGTLKRGENEITVQAAAPALQFADALVVLPATVELGRDSHEQRSATELLGRQIVEHSSKGGLTCLVYAEDFSASVAVGGFLLERWGLKVAGAGKSPKKLLAPQFEAYFRRFDYPGFSFILENMGSNVQLHTLYCQDRPELPAAFTVVEGNGLIYVVPANFVAEAELALLGVLAEAIQAHSAAFLRPDYAPIAESFVFGEENTIRATRQEKQAELDGLDETLASYRQKKDILFLRDDALADRLPRWMSEYLAFKTRRAEEYLEDFWLLDDNGQEIAICEAKALDKNVKREHIRQVALHRDERDLDDEFPGLLIANTYARTETEREKGKQRIGPRECRNAVKENVLVLRTLDLVRLLDQAERGATTKEEISALLTSESGWLKVEGDTRTVVKE